MKKVLFGLIGMVLLSASAWGTPIIDLYQNSLPNLFVNDPGPFRSNAAFGELNPNAPDGNFDGTAFTLPNNESAVITSITIYEIGSVLGEQLGDEFSDALMYFRPEGSTFDSLDCPLASTAGVSSSCSSSDFGSNVSVSYQRVAYNINNLNYDTLNGPPPAYFPIFAVTFSNLDLTVNSGVTYDLGFNGLSPNQHLDTGFGVWFMSYSNAVLSGGTQDGNNTYLRCSYTALDGPCFVEDPKLDGSWNKGADLNIDIQGTITPEPSTLALLGIGLIGVAWLKKGRRS